MNSRSNIQLFAFVQALQADLRAEKIDRAQFDFLLGVFLRKEFNLFLGKQLQRLELRPATHGKDLLSFSYRRDRQLNHAN